MSRWSWYEPAPKQPVPEDGLRVDRFGQTWWGEQWIRASIASGEATPTDCRGAAAMPVPDG